MIRKLILPIILVLSMCIHASAWCPTVVTSGNQAAVGYAVCGSPSAIYTPDMATPTDSGNNPAARNYRDIIPASGASGSASTIAVKITAGAGSLTVDHVTIGVSTADGVFDAAPTTITFAGQEGVTISSGQTVTSDKITFTFTSTVRHLIAFWMADRSYVLYDNGSDDSGYSNTTDSTDKSEELTDANASSAASYSFVYTELDSCD